MEVILLEKVGKLGELGDKASVKGGFGRNYLIPQGKAVPATKANIAKFEERRAELEAAAKEKLTTANSRAEVLNEKEITISTKCGEEGKLFGSIGTRDIADAITADGNKVDKNEVRLPEGVIRTTGEFDIAIQLHPEVTATVKLTIAGE